MAEATIAFLLQTARRNAGLTQEQAARRLGVSRSAIAHLETGFRPPRLSELERLSEIYGFDLSAWSNTLSPPDDPIFALFRADPALAHDEARAEAVRQGLVLCLKHFDLERKLGLDPEGLYPVVYAPPALRSRWDAVRQGQEIAELERARLALGDRPIADMTALLTSQGIHVAEAHLQPDISGAFVNHPQAGLSILVNADHTVQRKVFSYAHEYGHALMDRGRVGVVSTQTNRDELLEVRANAFAATFLAPDNGVRAFVRSLGKGESSRTYMQVHDGSETPALEAQRRLNSRSRSIQFFDVLRLAQYFGLSYETAAYRLLNLKLITDEQLSDLLAKVKEAAILRRVLREDKTSSGEHPPTSRLLYLGLEAYRQNTIGRSEFENLCAELGISRKHAIELVGFVQPGHEREA